jgi:hypothetical protein
MITWTTQPTSQFIFNGTDGNGLDFEFAVTRVGAGPQYTATLKKEGVSQGQFTFDNLAFAKQLFEHVAPALVSA